MRDQNWRLRLLTTLGALLSTSGCQVDPADVVAVVGVGILALILVLVFLVLFIYGLSRGLMKKKWDSFSVASGFFVGILGGMATILNVPEAIQYVVIGGLLGMGADWVASLKSPSGPKTAIDSLAGVVSETSDAIRNAAFKTQVKPASPRNLALFLWTAALAILSMLLTARALGPIYLVVMK